MNRQVMKNEMIKRTGHPPSHIQTTPRRITAFQGDLSLSYDYKTEVMRVNGLVEKVDGKVKKV